MRASPDISGGIEEADLLPRPGSAVMGRASRREVFDWGVSPQQVPILSPCSLSADQIDPRSAFVLVKGSRSCFKGTRATRGRAVSPLVWLGGKIE